MFKPQRIVSIINGLLDEGAVMFVCWDEEKRNPKVWLKDWCGPYRTGVSIATAESVLEEIRLGIKKKPPKPPLMVSRRLRIETCFVD